METDVKMSVGLSNTHERKNHEDSKHYLSGMDHICNGVWQQMVSG
jgi:hypothetical protein